MKRIAVLTLVVLLLHGCGTQSDDSPVPARNEIVMSPGMTITATAPIGTMRITAGNGLRRSYTWEGATRSVEMWPRGDRWYGSLGIYYPGPGNHWKEHNGIRRGVVQEGQQHFETEEGALNWLNDLKGRSAGDISGPLTFVHRKDGLVVAWGKVLERSQLNVDVWQIYVERKKPTNLPGANDDAITIDQPISQSLEVAAAGDETTAETDKIEALIKHIEGLADAKFVRNGSEYEAKTAAKFLRGKWDAKKDEIKTAEDFIAKAASVSSTSGKPYLIRFKDGMEIKAGEYLTTQLKKLGGK